MKHPTVRRWNSRAVIDLLAEEPRPPGCASMHGKQSTYRVGVGSYRIVYEVRDGVLIVLIIRIGHRREVYR